jgi:TolB-like protein
MILGLVLAVLTSPRKPDADAATGRDPRRIAVLYPDDYTQGRSLEYLGNGIVERLTHDLSQVDALEVVPLNAVKAYRDGKMTYDSLISKLDVGSVVEVSVQGSGERVRVTVKLTDTNTGKYLDSQTIDHELGELLSLQDSVSETVARSLRKALGKEIRVRERRAGTKNGDALELLFRGEKERDAAALIARRKHPRDAEAARRRLRIADSLLARAEAEDSEWVEPPTLRGRVALSLAKLLDEGPSRTAVLAAGLRHAEQALRKDPDDPGALEVRGTVLWQLVATSATTPAKNPRLQAAEQDLRRAIEIQPLSASAMVTLSQLLRTKGDYSEADLLVQKALDADAFLEDAEEILKELHMNAVSDANYRAAADWCARGGRLFPEHRYFVDCRLRLLVEDPSRRPDPNLAWRLVDEGNRVDPPDKGEAGPRYRPIYRQMAAAAVLARAGLKDSARAVVARARRVTDVDREMRVDVMYDEANVRLILGEEEEALRLLESYLAARPDQKSFIARDPPFRALRNDTRFQRIVRQ